jgi:7,8-dihydroneopterin aldolase/epimerase/oxygenase
MRNMEWLEINCRKLFLRGLNVQVQIGVHEFEKNAPQRVRVDVDLYVLLAATSPARDAIEEVVDYDFVREAVTRHVLRGPFQLQETLCDGLLEQLLQHPDVLAARVRTSKPDVYADCDAVGVEVFRWRTGK